MPELKQLHTTIVMPALPVAYSNSGIGTFSLHFIRLLRQQSYENIHVIYTGHIEKRPEDWKPYYDELGVKLQMVQRYKTPLQIPPGYPHHVYISELTDKLISSETDIIYFADFRANGLIYTRNRRYKSDVSPIVVTILHGCSRWHRQGQQLFTSYSKELQLDFDEQYVAEQSDFAIAPGQYTFEWARANDWHLPDAHHCFTPGYPWLPDRTFNFDATPEITGRFKRLIFYGRVETRKGIELFVESIMQLAQDDEMAPLLAELDELVILGQNTPYHAYHTITQIVALLEDATALPVRCLQEYNTFEAQKYLQEHVADSLVIIPSRTETFGYTLIEASLIKGLNVISSDNTGLTEVLGDSGKAQRFPATVKGLTAALVHWLQNGPKPAHKLAQYDWQAANQHWLDYHEQISQAAIEHKKQMIPGARKPPPLSGCKNKSVDVILTHYNLGDYLPYALESLANQTTDDFNLFILDDGSTDEDSRAAFMVMQQQYKLKDNWHFIQKESNDGVCYTRNLGASLGEAEYILFMDADNIATPHMVERFRDCIRTSGDDVLTAWQYSFQGEGSIYLGRAQARIPGPAAHYFLPGGNNPVLNLIYEGAFGDMNCIMRRSGFEKIGGFTTTHPKEINHEDRELFTRFSLAGYRLDVIPEFLYFYRVRSDSRLRISNYYENDKRVMQVYEDALKNLGLMSLPSLVSGLHYRLRDMELASIHTFRNPDGTTFYNLHEYLINGVSWRTLVLAFYYKIQKNIVILRQKIRNLF